MVFIYLGKKAYRAMKGSGKTQTTPATKSTATEGSTSENITYQDKNNQTSLERTSSTPTCGHQFDPASGPCPTCKSERKAQLKYRVKIFAGLVLPFVVQALDVTIVASALPWIAADFHETRQLNWIIAAFNLTSAAFIPFWGQIADIFGRHVSIQTCLVLMLIGSALCTGAPTDAFPVLLLGRGFQGLACAGLNVLVRIVIADKVTLRENAKNWAIFSFLGGVLGWGLGPVLGGYITSGSSWRWCFGINLPIAFVSMFILYFVLRSELLGPQPIPQLDETTETGRRTTFKKRLQTIDIGGQLLFLFGFGLLVLGLTWAGATYSWTSPAVLVTLILGVVISILFIVWEYHMSPGKALARRFPWQKAMIPWELVRNRDIGLLFYTSFATGMAMYSVLYFCNIYFTMVKLWSADQSGVQLLYFTPGLAVGVYASAFMCNGWPRKTFPPIFLGSILEMLGIGLLAWALWTEHNPTVYGMMALTGVGTGLRIMPVPLHGVGYFPKKIAAVISLMAVAYPFGGTLGLTIMTTVFNNASGIGEDSPLRDFEALSRLPAATQQQITHDAKMGVVWAFVAICPFMVLCTISASLLGNVYISKVEEGKDERQNEIYEGVYLLSYFRKGGNARNLRREHLSGGESTLE
ncbi:major facilitator superfamily transporter [Colletotrichum abscissum]|uniref:Major facilitator superfamily transporter n=1 Tax=Colletotrichum abscissum TaxID=1671311 RepID=A0A9Q0B515_9PEZI|nr:major facilitator superfamily transporter [Colletotrichum abscissum]KAI3555350.1 major facilitator superfamily transporter [Colletotrichum abscissum]KAK1490552.1 major facilitator superfamily transporter [Colletotrichum abscissum]